MTPKIIILSRLIGYTIIFLWLSMLFFFIVVIIQDIRKKTYNLLWVILYCLIYMFGFNLSEMIFFITRNLYYFYILQGVFMGFCSFMIGKIIYKSNLIEKIIEVIENARENE